MNWFLLYIAGMIYTAGWFKYNDDPEQPYYCKCSLCNDLVHNSCFECLGTYTSIIFYPFWMIPYLTFSLVFFTYKVSS